MRALTYGCFCSHSATVFIGSLPPLTEQFARHVRPKIRQQLQVLRDLGLLTFLGDGRYRLS